jgi:hypothetical protein
VLHQFEGTFPGLLGGGQPIAALPALQEGEYGAQVFMK